MNATGESQTVIFIVFHLMSELLEASSWAMVEQFYKVDRVHVQSMKYDKAETMSSKYHTTGLNQRPVSTSS